MHVWNRHSRSSSSTMVEDIRVVEVEAKRVDVSGLDSTRVLLDKSDVNNFSKNVFRALHSDVSSHAER